MTIVRACRADDLAVLQAQAKEGVMAASGDLAAIAALPGSRVLEHEGQPLAAGGLLDQGGGVAVAWALVGPVEYRLLRPFMRAYREALEQAPFHWIEAHVRTGFALSIRWVFLLGFEAFGTMKIEDHDYHRFVYR